MREVQPHALGPLIRLEIARHGIGPDNIQFSERIALGRDATSTRGIPARHIAAGGRARFNVKDDFSIIAHTEKIRVLETGVNKQTFAFPSKCGSMECVRRSGALIFDNLHPPTPGLRRGKVGR